jgi:succinate dehydrogenase/fumarate reductase cytochrome b subunit
MKTGFRFLILKIILILTLIAILITDWLSFIQHDYKNISSIYHRLSGEIIMFVDKMIYTIDFRSLILVT